MKVIKDKKEKKLIDETLDRNEIKKCPKCKSEVEYYIDEIETQPIHSIHHYEAIGVETSPTYVNYHCPNCDVYLNDGEILNSHIMEIFDEYKNEEVPLPPHLEESNKNIQDAIKNTSEKKD